MCYTVVLLLALYNKMSKYLSDITEKLSPVKLYIAIDDVEGSWDNIKLSSTFWSLDSWVVGYDWISILYASQFLYLFLIVSMIRWYFCYLIYLLSICYLLFAAAHLNLLCCKNVKYTRKMLTVTRSSSDRLIPNRVNKALNKTSQLFILFSVFSLLKIIDKSRLEAKRPFMNTKCTWDVS